MGCASFGYESRQWCGRGDGGGHTLDGCGDRPRLQRAGWLLAEGACETRKYSTYEGEEEEDDVHDGKGEAGLQHGAVLARILGQTIVCLSADISEWPQVQVDAVICLEVPAAGLCDAAQLVDCRNQCADEEKVNEGYESTTRPGAKVEEEGTRCPSQRQCGDNEEH